MNAFTLHLTVLQATISEDSDPTQVGAICNPQRTEIVWNDSFTTFRLVPLNWWDDASYIAYQARDIDAEICDDDAQDAGPEAPMVAAPSLPAVDSDEIPF